MFFKEIYEPRLDDYDMLGRLSPESILKILECCAEHHSRSVSDKALNNGIAWILAEWYMEIFRYPNFSEELHITTWIHGKTASSAAYRDFIATDKNGGELFRASAKFALTDMSNNKPTRISPELFASYGPENNTACLHCFFGSANADQRRNVELGR